MAMIGGGMMTPFGGAKVIQLTSSTDKFEVKDQDGAPLLRIGANGDLHLRGGVRQI